MSRVPDPATLLDLSQDKVAVLDEDGIVRHLNETITDCLGFESNELVGTDAFALVHPDDESTLRAAFDAIVDGSRDPTEPLEYRYATADGEWLWLRTRVHTPVETGVDGYVLLSRNVTQEVEPRQRLETIAATSADVFWMFSADWTELLFINDAVTHVFGLSKADIERRPTRFLEVIHPDDRPYVERAMRRLSAGESIHLDYRTRTVDGQTKWVRVPGEPVVEGGDVVAVTGFARDVTDEYRRERQLTVIDNLLRHTIRNHMNVIDGTAELIIDELTGADGLADPGAPDPVDDCIEHAETIRRVADDLLTTAEKQRGVIGLLRQPGSPEPVDIEPIVAEAIAIATDGEHSPAEVSVSCSPDVRAITHEEIDYAIAELIENAIDHAESSPVVRVDVTIDDGSVEISVRDNCTSIPPEERHVITDRWEMDELHHTSGMGLWLVYWIVDRSGGDLEFDTHENGNVVTIAVPSADCDGRPETVAQTKRPTATPNGPGVRADIVSAERTETDGGAGDETD